MKPTFSVLVIAILFFVMQPTYAQNNDSTPSKNVVHASFGTIAFVGSGNLVYDRLISHKSTGFFKSYYATAGVGAYYTSSISENASNGIVTFAGITGLTGTGKHHFETKLGVGYYFDTAAEGNRSLDSSLFPNVNVGYRMQKPDGGFMLRAGIGVHEFAYLGLGFSF